MRKFVIKNRQKRKYNRKIEKIYFFSFSKDAYGMLPLLVMFIAFMSPMIISTPFRDTLSNVKFTFELPEFSLTNPLSFIQSLAGDITHVSLLCWTLMLDAYGTFSQTLIALFNSINHDLLILGNTIELQGTA